VTRHSDSASDLITSVSTPTHQSPQSLDIILSISSARHHDAPHCRPRRRPVLRRSLCVAPAGRPVYCDHCDGTAPLHHRRIHGAATRLPLLVPPISLDSIRIPRRRDPTIYRHPTAITLTRLTAPSRAPLLSIDSRLMGSASQHLLILHRPVQRSILSLSAPTGLSITSRLFLYIHIISGLGTVRLG